MSSIRGGKSNWKAGGDRGRQEFAMSDEQWDRIFGGPALVRRGPALGACPEAGGCASCPDPEHCAGLRESCGFPR